MNQPNNERFEKIEERLEKLEQERKELLRQVKLTRFDAQEIKAIVGRIELDDIGTARERLDMLEQGQQELKQILQQNYKAILEGMIKTVEDGTSEIKLTQGTHSERFDAVKVGIDELKTTMATKDDIADLKSMIQQLLPPKSGEGQP
jgi:hypothetical protein